MTINWEGDERRNGSVRTQLLKAIDSENDAKMRNNYMLMLAIIETMDNGFSRIEKKLEHILNDEKTIKRLVLDGHVEKHHQHHDWVENRIATDKYYTDLIARAMPMLEWAEKRKDEEERLKPVCEWASQKMTEEIIAKQDKKSLLMKFIESIISHIGTAIAVGAIAYFTFR